MLVGLKLLLLAASPALALHARLRQIPNLTDENLTGLAWHIRGITALATHQFSTLAKISGATIVASDSIMNFGVSSASLPQLIFSFGTAPE